eukprot:156438-Ditylum_brightwellii.AAC.1
MELPPNMSQWFEDINIFSLVPCCVKAKNRDDSSDEEDGATPRKEVPQNILDKIDACELSINPWKSKEYKHIFSVWDGETVESAINRESRSALILCGL